MTARITAPAGLGPAGRHLWSEINKQCADDGMVLDAREARWLRDAAFEADQLDRLEQALKTAPLEVVGASGQPRVNGLLAEASRSRAAVAALLARLRLDEPADAATGRSGSGSRTTSASARRASMIGHGQGPTGLGA